MNSEPPPLPPKRSLTLAVILAFVPSAIGLILGSFHIPTPLMPTWCVVAAIIALVCCAVSSFLLFRRNTTVAIVFAILLGLLNLAIVAGFGCAAMLSGMNVH